jgi:hypothetical protein
VSNPFAPTFGTTPPLLVGRDEIIDDFRDALVSGPGAPGRATLVTGLRGTGKTVILNAFEDVAREVGWVVISETATPRFLDRLVEEHLPLLLRRFDPKQTESEITGASIAPIGGIQRSVKRTHEPHPGLRDQLFRLADIIHEQSGAGVLITLDEVHRKQIDEIRELGAVVQHAFREGRAVAFAGAGLPSSVSDLLNDEVSTFLRRADRVHLDAVGRPDVERAIEVPVQDQGYEISATALQIATDGTRGYPFMIQLVGWHTWQRAGGADHIDEHHARQGVEKASRKVGALVHAPALADLSDIDRSFLAAMAHDDGPSRIKDLAQRLDVSGAYIGQYRRRLLESEMIYAPKYGWVDFTLPALRQYLREHAASSEWATET